MWFRGILPKELTVLPEGNQPIEAQQLTINDTVKEWTSGTYYGDASGGKYTKYKMLRRVGCAVVSVDDEGQVVLRAHTPLPGPVQTVGRGELFALLILIQILEPCSDIVFVTDNYNVYNTYNQGPKSANK